MKLSLLLTILVILGLIIVVSFFIYNKGIFRLKGDLNIDKQVKVDLSQQKMFLFEKGEMVKKYNISSGLSDSPTPKGEYTIIYKQDKVYSKIAGCWLSYWVGFTRDGLYGFHETPVCDGTRDGEEDIGNPASQGCIRLKKSDADDFYVWSEINIPIEIY